MNGPVARSWINDLDVYVGGKSKTDGVKNSIKLSSNESALGPSPLAMEAYRNAAHKLHRYPDSAYTELRQTLADKYDIDPTRIVCGVGSDEILKLACRAYLSPGDEVIYSRYGFMMYPVAAKSVGAVPIEAPDQDYTSHVDSILSCVTDRTKIIFLANPNNPTGTYLNETEVERLWQALPNHVLLVLDAAYAEFVRAHDYDAGIKMVEKANNIIMTRTFSKLFGLASIRLGWGYACTEIANTLDKMRDPFNVPSSAQIAGVAALNDTDFQEKALAHNDKWLAWLSDEIDALGLHVIPSVANFILIKFPEGEKSAENANAYLLARGYILRWLPNQGLGDCLRLTVGTEDENKAVITLFKEFLGS